MRITKAVQAKLYLNQSQRNWLAQQFGDIRFTWNYFLNLLQQMYKLGHKFPRKYDLYNALPFLKAHYKWLKEADSRSLQIELSYLYISFQKFFQKQGGHPKFKSRKYFQQSYTTSSTAKVIDKRHIKLAKLGLVKAHLNMPVTGKIKQATVTQEPNGSYYVSLTVQCESQALPKTNHVAGIDVGLDDLAILSNGMKWNFKYYSRANEHRKRIWQRKLARRRAQAKRFVAFDEREQKRMPNHRVKPLSAYSNYQKAKRIVAKISRHERNQRRNYLQQLTTWLVRHFDLIAVEDLHVQQMMHNHHLNRAEVCASWRMFRTLLTYKCAWYGKIFEAVNPNYTSQVCHTCGLRTGKKPLNVRSFRCPFCNTEQDRDVNASRNILRLGLEQAVANNWSSILQADPRVHL